ncbi:MULTISPECIES: hypothetical protein [unclassified Clostridium]|jgi:hypothetical protein|uniref:hypothetical protein n=1 Tax=unclassified Clostridium TaxID=2614128 RepID=UPI0015F33A79|nr:MULTISPECIES: hypothetical protein [unclassified Clostridium]
MTALLELRENLKKIYSRNEAFILPVIKFLLGVIVLSIINGKMGYMTKLDNMAIVLIVSLLCSFLPTGFMAFFAMMFAVLHMYALSIETAAVGLVVFLLLYLLFLRFTAKEALVVVLTPVLCMLKLPYVMPVAMGLIGTPASCVSVGCGVVVYYLLQTVITNAPTINSMGAEEATAKLRLLIDGMLGNKAMLVMIAAFAITVIVVYLIRRMSVDHSWTIAMVAGVMIEVMILLVGDLMYDTNLSIVSALLGAVVTLIACKIIEFFRFCLDYSRTEKVQFEDDEYYYYVKAVPKMTVAAPTNTVKKINTQRRPAGQQTRTSGQGTRSAGQTYRSTAHTGRPSEGTGRSVVTERTPAGNGVPYGQQGGYRGHEMSGGRSVTIGGNHTNPQDDSDDYEELF